MTVQVVAGNKGATSGQAAQHKLQEQHTQSFLEQQAKELQMHPFTLAFKSTGLPASMLKEAEPLSSILCAYYATCS